MPVMSYDEFWAFYEKYKKFPDVTWAVNKTFKTESAKRTRYRQYTTRYSRRLDKASEKSKAHKETVDIDVTFRKTILARDKGCQLKKILSITEMHELLENAHGFDKALDVAHIESRAAAPEKKYDPNNVILLNHYSHLNLDQGKHPLNGKAISAEEKQSWWSRILGGRNV